MPITPTYPGVYIEELPSSVRTITTVSTSVTAFVGYTRRGELNTPVTVTSFADYERRFGGLSSDSPVSYAVQQFFLNGGSVAIVVRLASGAKPASGVINGGGKPSVTITAKEAGSWSNNLRVAIDPTPSGDTFDLRVFDSGGAVRESFTQLTVDRTHSRFVELVVNPSSTLVNVVAAADAVTPTPSGTVSKAFSGALPDVSDKPVDVTIGSESHSFTLYAAADLTKPTNLPQLALLLERKIRGAAPGTVAFASARVHVIGTRLQVVSGQPDATVSLAGEAAGLLGLQESAGPAAYPLSGAQNGSPPKSPDFIGSPDAKTGMYALRDTEDVNLLCLPEVAGFDSVEAMIPVLAAAEKLCQDKRMFLIVDSPASWGNLDQARAGLPSFDSVRGNHAALYFPHIQLTDPLTGQLRDFPPSGAIAGIMARIDAERGVWKAPAGTEARISGVRALTVPLTDQENGLLNPLGVNCLRSIPVVGPVVWGARTLEGADQLASQWKYVPVRRLALMIEESLYRGVKWVVFEPNDERLWGQIRLNVGAFLHTLFQQGAFQGTTARQAYFVKCDKDTTSQDEINRGVVNIVVGFAPLKPAEFVIVKIEQIAGQIEV